MDEDTRKAMNHPKRLRYRQEAVNRMLQYYKTRDSDRDKKNHDGTGRAGSRKTPSKSFSKHDSHPFKEQLGAHNAAFKQRLEDSLDSGSQYSKQLSLDAPVVGLHESAKVAENTPLSKSIRSTSALRLT